MCWKLIRVEDPVDKLVRLDELEVHRIGMPNRPYARIPGGNHMYDVEHKHKHPNDQFRERLPLEKRESNVRQPQLPAVQRLAIFCHCKESGLGVHPAGLEIVLTVDAALRAEGSLNYTALKE